jgi:ubiquinone/menaquinone biosynthesis C-methylase UbiE
MSDIYNRFASVYDHMAMDLHSRRMCEYTLDLFRRFRIKPDTGLEICCGTGSALKFFSEHGYAMVGVDQSSQMLAVARHKNGKKVRLIRRSISRSPTLTR